MRMIIDSNYLCYRTLHSGYKDLSYRDKKVGVIFGFIVQILKLADQFKTKDFIFCWDSKQSYRKLVSPEYKSNRKKNREVNEDIDYDDVFRQFDVLRNDFLPYMGFKNIFHQGGYESDDLIALICYRLPDDTMIVSCDNDLFQLLNNNRFCPVRMWNFKTINDETRFTRDWFGLKPKDWIKVKAIAGCDGDNVVGLDGVGNITAAKYVAGILNDGKIKERISSAESKVIIDRNFYLVALPFPGLKPIKIQWIYPDNISVEKFESIFGQYGFRSLLGEGSKKWKAAFFEGDANVKRRIVRE